MVGWQRYDGAVFSWSYCVDENAGCTSESSFDGVVSVRAIDSRPVEIAFDGPTPYPYQAFVGTGTPIISRAQFADCVGAAATGCEKQNTAPLGTGPYRITGFKTNEEAVYERNPFYRGETPYFDRVVIKRGGQAISAARAVLERGEADYAWNLQIEPDTLAGMEAGGCGTVAVAFTSLVDRIVVNQTNSGPALGENRSEFMDGQNPHPFLTFKPIRQAMSMAIDRSLISEQLYGIAAEPTCNLIAGPPNYASTANDGCLAQDIEGANRLLDDNGVLDADGDGIREYDVVPLRVAYQTSTNAIQQDTQALILDWWRQIGIETEVVHHDASVFFGGDPVADKEASYRRFFADLQMYAGSSGIDPPGRPLAAPLLQAYPDPGQQLVLQQQCPLLRPGIRRTLRSTGTDPDWTGSGGAGKAAQQHLRTGLLRDSDGGPGRGFRAPEYPAGRPDQRLGQRVVEHRGVAPLVAGR